MKQIDSWNFSINEQTFVLLDVSKSEVHESTFAAIVAKLPGAIDQVLLREGGQLASLAEVLSLKGTGLNI